MDLKGRTPSDDSSYGSFYFSNQNLKILDVSFLRITWKYTCVKECVQSCIWVLHIRQSYLSFSCDFRWELGLGDTL